MAVMLVIQRIQTVRVKIISENPVHPAVRLRVGSLGRPNLAVDQDRVQVRVYRNLVLEVLRVLIIMIQKVMMRKLLVTQNENDVLLVDLKLHHLRWLRINLVLQHQLPILLNQVSNITSTYSRPPRV